MPQSFFQQYGTKTLGSIYQPQDQDQMKAIFIALTLCFCLSSAGLFAQEEIKAEKYEDPQWYWVVQVDFVEGKMEKAKSLIENYFMKAGEESGVPGPAMIMEMSSGDYDMMFVWHMKDGIEGMNWKTSPEDVKWLNAMTKVAGSAEEAQKIWKEYESCIARTNANLARKAW